MGQIRRTLSCSFVRSQALCLVSRLGQLGAGAKGAAERRKAAQKAEYGRQLEAQAHWDWMAHVRGRELGKSGSCFVA